MPLPALTVTEQLRELSHTDRITQLQDEIQQLLAVMARTVAYLTPRTPPSSWSARTSRSQNNVTRRSTTHRRSLTNKELVVDLMAKAKQVEYLIKSFPVPESEDQHAQQLQALSLDDEMATVNKEYTQAMSRSDVLRFMPEGDEAWAG
ncbi:hypothetical protein GGX14DRAFT_603909 [Mycena pura]|uniref:Mediator of RNA polymerase II transcription subunit 21 n=1 Tax=Mycena pura TaxID=153505 RepID=A0AAD6UMA2_9AGAR|nr:hypothetical protein GGX14DRAFT_603909 [Mycena pura]